MRIVDPERPHAAISPKDDNAHHLRPKLLPVLAAEIDWKNVFVFFRRILGVFDRPVRPGVKPFRMFFHIRMIRRAIDREIERDFHSALSDFAQKPVEVA